jgi:hypothetical protein
MLLSNKLGPGSAAVKIMATSRTIIIISSLVFNSI